MPLCAWLPGTKEDEFSTQLRGALRPGIHLGRGAQPPEEAPVRVLIDGIPSAERLDALPSLERVLIPYAGVPEATRALLAARPQLALHNLHHNAASTAELAVALLLAATKRIVPHDQDLRRGDWRRRFAAPTSQTLAGRRALVLGYGAIGRRVAQALRGLGLSVEAVRRRGEDGAEGPDGIRLHGPDQLEQLLPRAQVLMVCLPLTAETRGVLDASALARLPRDTCLVNIGRGALVDEGALYDALLTGRIDSAGLDVWYRYPKGEEERADTQPSIYPFGELENVVLSPHRAGLTRQNEAARAAAVADVLHAVLDGTTVPGRVDPTRGY
jgi:phosphoglycerate dehydrogenase-like enzyme